MTRPPSDRSEATRLVRTTRHGCAPLPIAGNTLPFARVAIASLIIADPIAAHAAGLGRLSVQSTLGQPLQAEVELTLQPGESLAEISGRVVIPPSQSSVAVDPQHSAILAGASISAHRRANGQPYLRIRTSRALNEPLLEFVVELQGGGGAVGRWYAALLDPPGYTETVVQPRQEAPNTGRPVIAPLPGPGLATAPAPAPAPAPAESAGAPVRGPDPAPVERGRAVEPRVPRNVMTPPRAAASAPESSATASSATAIGGQYGPVRPGETLYGIAARVRAPGLTVEQTQRALFQANPGAFIDGSMSKLRAGAVLSIPGADGMRVAAPAPRIAPAPERTPEPPARPVARESVPASTSTRTAQPTGPAATVPSGDRLTIVDPSAGNDSGLTPDESALLRRRQTLEGELAARQDELRVIDERISRLQVGDLSERIRVLEEVAKRRQAELEEVSRRIEQLSSAEPTSSPAPDGAPETAAATAPRTATAPTVGGNDAPGPASAVPSPAAPAERKALAPAPAPASDGGLDPLVIAGLSGVALAFLGGFGFWWSRRRRRTIHAPRAATAAGTHSVAPNLDFGPSSRGLDPAFSRPGGELSGAVDTKSPHSVDPAIRAQLDALAKEWAEEEAVKTGAKASAATKPPSIDDDSLDFSLEPLPSEKEQERKHGKPGLDLRLD